MQYKLRNKIHVRMHLVALVLVVLLNIWCTPRTTIYGFGTFLRVRLRVRVTTRGAASDCARGAGLPFFDSAFGGASSWLACRPIAW